MSMSTHRTLLLAALTFLSTTSVAEDVADHLQGRWFEVEIVLFERLPVLDINSSEQLTQHTTRSWPRNLTDLIQPDAVSTSGRFPDDGSQWCLGYPQLAQREPLQRSDRDRFRELQKEERGSSPLEPASPPVEQPLQRSATPAELAYQRVLQDIAAYEQDLIRRALVLSDELTLTPQVKTLNRQRHLRPLLHQRWLMPVPPRDAPLSVYVATENTPRAPATRSGHAKVEGFIELSVGRYLHLAPTLWYHADNLGLAPITLPVAPLQFRAADAYRELRDVDTAYMVLQQSRRMRSEELHYIDHPKIGMLVRIDPVPPPAALQAQLEEAMDTASGPDQPQ